MSSIDPTLCPLCGKDNLCAVTLGQDPSNCWCHQPDMVIDKILLAKIPHAARGKACICQKCVALEAQARQDGEHVYAGVPSSDGHLNSFFEVVKKP